MRAARRGRSAWLRCRLIMLLLVALSAPALSAQTEDASSPLVGQPLTAALLELRERGLKVVFSSRNVTPHMTVLTEPTESDPRQILDQLLAPHGLVAQDGPNGSVVVVLAHGKSSGESLWITGTVRSRDGEHPIPGVEVQLVTTGVLVTTGAGGDFQLQAPRAGLYALDIRRRGFVIEHLEGVQVEAGQPTELSIVLDRAPVTQEAMVVTPSRVSLMGQQPAMPLALSRDDILGLPHLGDDFFRALTLLPGVTGNDVSAEFHVRGGRSDETQILLDGQELYETYHLKDFESALSVVAAATLDNVDLSTGGFPVEHGDRMSGVLDMTTRTPSGPRRTQLGASLLNLQAGGAGLFADGRGGWLAQARRGSIELASKLLGPEEPQYWDTFGRLDFQATSRHGLRANVLHSADEFKLESITIDGIKSRDTFYRTSYFWLTHSAILGEDLLLESAVSRSRVERDRRGFEMESDVQFDILDRRELEVHGLRQDWDWRPNTKHQLKWGFELRTFEADYNYDGSYNFESPLAQIRQNPNASATVFQEVFNADHDSVYLADRFDLGERTTFEFGLRHDRHTLTDESLLSPRANLAVQLAPRSVLRASWGRFTQSQRPYELQVEDGDTAFSPVERSVHRVLGFEHFFGGSDTDATRGLALRLELYRRNVDNPLARFENLYEPINSFPEVEPDRVRIAPDRSPAEGLELFLRGRRPRMGWWLNYTYSRSIDVIDGRHMPRRFDQPHALNLDIDLRFGEHWTLNLAWRYHTGWPTTPLRLEQTLATSGDEGEPEIVLVPVLGPRFSQRLPDYHRLDMRASRRWTTASGSVTFFADVQNAYDRLNISGFDFEIDEEAARLITNPEHWAQILPSLGVSIDF